MYLISEVPQRGLFRAAVLLSVLFLAIIQISVLLYDRIAEYIRILHGYVQEVRNKVCIVYLLSLIHI